MKGTQVHQFKILDKIGEGGMGEVYEALDTRLERRVALKFLPPTYSKDPEFKSRFEHEAKAAAALNHPNIITVHDLGEHEGRTYIAMELVSGQTLEGRIRSGDLALQETLKIVSQVCDGLSAAHEAGIVHRDIKPANIVLCKDGRVKILDFGLAKSRRATTDTKVGTTVGTVQYESPEQSRGGQVDGRSDLFSLGVVLYEMITAQRPFKGEFEEAIRYAIANEQPEPLVRYKSDVPDDLQRIVSKLLEKDPDLRYQTASGLLSDLKLLQRSSGPSSVHSAYHSTARSMPGPIAATTKKAGPRRLVIPAVAVVAIAAALLLFKPWKLDFQPTHEAAAGENRLAVMYFEDFHDPLGERRQGEIVANLLISDISDAQQIQVVSSQRLYDLLKQLGKEGTRVISPDMATQVAQKANARWMLTGSIVESDPQWVVTAQLSEVTSGDVIASPTIKGQSGERVYEVVDRLTSEIRRDLSLPASPQAKDRRAVELTTSSTEAYRMALEGKEFLNQLRTIDAEERFRAALAIDSTFALAYYGLAASRTTTWGDFVGARKYNDLAMHYADRATELERLYIQALDCNLRNKPREAVAIYERLLERYPEEKDALRFLATLYRNTPQIRDVPKAIELQQRVLKLDPLFAPAYNELAYYYDDLGNYEKSIWAINEYIKRAPNEPNPYDSRGELYANGGQLEPALASYRKAIEIDSNFIGSYRGAVAMHLFLGQYDEAERLAQTLIHHAQADARAAGRDLRVGIQVYQGRLKEALRLAQSELKEDRDELGESLPALWPYFGIAGLQALLGDFKEARRWAADGYDLAARLDTTGTLPSYLLVARIRMEEVMDGARIDSLMGELQRAVLRLPTFDSLELELAKGILAFQKQRYDSAAAHFEASAGDHPSWIKLNWLGRAYAEGGRLRDAVRVFEQAQDSYESNRWDNAVESVRLHYWLGEVYEKSGRTDKAIEQYDRFLDIWKNADPGLPEVADAKARLAALQT
jgi:eukaryotic-like serine/threonine-protein kinase